VPVLTSIERKYIWIPLNKSFDLFYEKNASLKRTKARMKFGNRHWVLKTFVLPACTVEGGAGYEYNPGYIMDDNET